MATREEILKELHKPAQKNFPRRKIIIKDFYETLSIDLAEMIPYASQNHNNKYILCAIDNFSKFAYALPLKNKSGPHVAAAMDQILSKCPAKVKFIHSDQGKEFYNKHFQKVMKKWGIKHFHTFTHLKAAICERFLRTLKGKLWFNFDLRGNHKWDDKLQKVLTEYNNSKHRTINMAPAMVNRKNAKEVFNRVYAQHVNQPNRKKKKLKYKMGDFLRISKQKQLFEKGYLANFTTEIFQVRKIIHSTPPVYLLKDLKGNPISGAFYEQELQKTRWPNTFLVSKVLQRKNGKAKVRWLGFPPSEDSWVDEKDIV